MNRIEVQKHSSPVGRHRSPSMRLGVDYSNDEAAIDNLRLQIADLYEAQLQRINRDKVFNARFPQQGVIDDLFAKKDARVIAAFPDENMPGYRVHVYVVNLTYTENTVSYKVTASSTLAPTDSLTLARTIVELGCRNGQGLRYVTTPEIQTSIDIVRNERLKV